MTKQMTEKKSTRTTRALRSLKWVAADLFHEDRFDEIYDRDLLKPLTAINWSYSISAKAVEDHNKFRNWAAGKVDSVPSSKRSDFICYVNKTLRKLKRAKKWAVIHERQLEDDKQLEIIEVKV